MWACFYSFYDVLNLTRTYDTVKGWILLGVPLNGTQCEIDRQIFECTGRVKRLQFSWHRTPYAVRIPTMNKILIIMYTGFLILVVQGKSRNVMFGHTLNFAMEAQKFQSPFQSVYIYSKLGGNFGERFIQLVECNQFAFHLLHQLFASTFSLHDKWCK